MRQYIRTPGLHSRNRAPSFSLRQPLTPQPLRLAEITVEEMHDCQRELVIRRIEDGEIRPAIMVAVAPALASALPPGFYAVLDTL